MLQKLIIAQLLCFSLILADYQSQSSTSSVNSSGKPCKLNYDYFPEEGFCNKGCLPLWEYNEYYGQALYICDPDNDDGVGGYTYCCSNATSGTMKWVYKEGETRPERISEKKCWEQHYTPIPPNAFISGIFALPEEFPHFSIIGWQNSNGAYDFKCTGSLIAPNFVLIAAHCASLNGQVPNVVKVGGTNVNNEAAEVLPVTKVITHPEYTQNSLYNDIALLQLGKPSSNPIACLWQTDATYHDKATAIAYGYTGSVSDGPKYLLKENLTITTNDYCEQHFPPNPRIPNGIIDSQMCIFDPNIKDTCKFQDDTGGPLEVKIIRSLNQVPIILGIQSFAKTCTGPLVYTRISSYLDWIESIVWK